MNDRIALVLRRHPMLLLVVFGGFAWATFLVTTAGALRNDPPSAGFDLELLLRGARRVSEGVSPYEPAMLNGDAVGITTLFYSYPPLVAQALSPLVDLPFAGLFFGLIAVSAAGLAVVAVRLAQDHAVVGVRPVAIASLALLPFWFPFSLAMLFGNLDMVFPALFGAILLVAVARPTRGRVIVAGIALALATVTKLHPAVLGIWLLARAVREWRAGRLAEADPDPNPERSPMRGVAPPSMLVAGVAAATGLVILACSLVVGGLQPWLDYVTVVRASSSVDLLDPRNLGPAAQLAMALGLSPAALQPLQAAVIGVAIIVTVLAAVFVEDPLESLLWATVASLVVLPVTWYHHFAVLIPFGVVCVSRVWGRADAKWRRLATTLFALTIVLAALVFGTVATWILVPAAFVLVRLSRGVRFPGAQAVLVSAAGTG